MHLKASTFGDENGTERIQSRDCIYTNQVPTLINTIFHANPSKYETKRKKNFSK